MGGTEKVEELRAVSEVMVAAKSWKNAPSRRSVINLANRLFDVFSTPFMGCNVLRVLLNNNKNILHFSHSCPRGFRAFDRVDALSPCRSLNESTLMRLKYNRTDCD
ncbi:hypothetical protein Nepgr_003436 [Nepenthes gracilis]|uniref:Uncharacterized protein n=1 Tax=Nepenthes gracilis TaxID=150966 RepID=A0AAD3RZJ9_NEPGR|nr:hypothetical protein Nepgr_003436 [Nepenthes gracilis]